MMTRKTLNNRPKTLTCGSYILDLSTPQVMGILNVAPHSFSSVGRFTELDEALRHAEKMQQEGAAIIDIGGEPTHPGVHPITSEQEELDRVTPIVEAISRELSIPISVDTSKPNVMKEAISKGASFINDVRALRHPGSLEVIASAGVPICLMHMLYPDGKPNEHIACELTDNPITAIQTFLQERINTCLAAGISKNNILIDPGIGHGSFGKTQQQNLQILNQLDRFQDMPFPLLVGVSRKTFIGNILDQPVEERLYGSLGATAVAVMKGASIIRTHDVKETVQAIKVVMAVTVARS
jgi:dihydropteroate synthase